MKKALILYFSGTGNTWWASERLAALLRENHLEAEAVSIENDRQALYARIKQNDLIFLNYPVYGSDRPEIVKFFIAGLPEADRKPFGIVCTQLAFSGDGAWLEHELIESRGYKINWAFHLRMPNNISIPFFPFGYTNDRTKLGRILSGAEKKLNRLAKAVAEDRQSLQGTTAVSNLLGKMQRVPYRKMFPTLRDDLSIDPQACTLCGRCIRFCPAGNIRFAEKETGGFPEFQGKCILCLRCYNFCSEQAILYRNNKFRPGKGSRKIPYRGPAGDFRLSLLKPEKD